MFVKTRSALRCATGFIASGCGRSDEKPAFREPAVTEGVVTVSDGDFDEVTAKGTVLVDFWSNQCPPCRRQGPVVDQLAKSFAGRAIVAKLDVLSNSGTPRRFGLKFIPTLIIFKEGREVKRFTGFQDEAVLASALEDALGGE